MYIKKIKFPKDNVFKTKKNRLLFGRIIHLYIEKLISNPKVANKIYHNLNFLLELVKNEIFSGLDLNKTEKKIVKYAWIHIRKNIKTNLKKFINKLLKDNYKPLIEFPLFEFKTSNKFGKIKIKQTGRPDIILINHNKKDMVIIEIKSGIKYESHKRQLKKYKKLLTKSFPNYKINVFLYIENKDKLIKLDKNE